MTVRKPYPFGTSKSLNYVTVSTTREDLEAAKTLAKVTSPPEYVGNLEKADCTLTFLSKDATFHLRMSRYGTDMYC